LDLAIAARTIDSWLRSGRLIRVHKGVYAVGYRREDPLAVAKAAVMAAGDGAALSHDSAAALWGLRRWPRDAEVIAPGCVRRKGITAHRSTTLLRRDLTTQYGIRTTTVARTLTDIRRRLTPRQFASLVNQARLGHTLSTDAATQLLGAPAPITRSQLERDFLTWTARHRLPTPIINTRLHGYEVDVLFGAHRLIVELDDYATHGDRATFAADRERDAIHAEHGYLTIRLTRERFTAREARRLKQILADRGTQR
jgi:very-short-patch-repair endonuclease